MVQLREDVKYMHYLTFLFVSGSAICLIAFTNAMQSFLLTEIYNVSLDDLGKTSGTIGIADEIWSFISLGFFGLLSDKYGRRRVVALGFLQVAIALFCMPHLPNVFPGLMCARLLYAQGSSAVLVMMTALLADYVQDESLGKAAGSMGLASGVGALIAIFLFVGQLPQWSCISMTYYFVGTFALCAAIIAHLCLDKTITNQGDQVKLWKNLKVGLALAKDNRYVFLSYISGFMARSGTVIVSIFVSLLVNKFYQENDLCANDTFVLEEDAIFTICGETLLREDKQLCRQAFTRSSAIGGIIQTLALLGAPLFGILCDRMANVAKVIFLSALLGAISYLAFGLTAGADPSNNLVLLIAIAVGLAEIFMVIAAQVSVTKKAMPAELRGAVAGCYSFIGGLGIAISSLVGGYLFDFFAGAPFLMAALFNVVIAGVAFSILINPEREEEEDRPKKILP